MIYTSYTKTDAYYEFVGDEGKLIVPSTDVILVDDESGMLAIKNTASRCTVGLVKKGSTPPTPPVFQGKWLATYSGGTTTSAECGASSAITTGEINPTNLVAVEIGDCVTSIGDNAFKQCSGLTSIDIPSGVTSIGEAAFRSCSSLSSVTISDSVTTIGNQAFYKCTNLTSIDIPSGVTNIGTHAFSQCESLTSIDIPSGVTSINTYTFGYCTSLTSVTIPNTVTSIGDSVFLYCSGLTSIEIPSGVTSIGGSAFSNCTRLTSIDIPDSVTSIGGAAFSSCSGITSCTIGSGVTSIGYNVLKYCSGLTSVTVNATTPPTLGSGAFVDTNDCPIYVPAASVNAYKAASGWSTYASRIQAIPSQQRAWLATYADSSTVSADCESSHGVIFEDSITKNNLVSVVIDDCVNMLFENAFKDCSSLSSVTFGSGVTSIGENAFTFCTSLTSIDIPSGVTSISERAFEFCTSLTSVTIPNSVTSIGDYAFRNCDRLEFVVVNATTPPTLGSNAFDGAYNLVIYVPSASVSAYQSAWSDYASNIQGR